MYMAASSGMDMLSAIDCLDRVRFTSTKKQEWSIPEVAKAMEDGSILYAGKYSAPDYEALLLDGCDIAIESTMIYHSPKIREKLLSLGIPVLVERSSYESDPIGRLEWIRLYGLLMGKEKEADAFFDAECEKVYSVENNRKDPPRVAFFSISDSGYATIRKPGDYVSKMIEMAGGSYVPSEEKPDRENALSTMNIQMEKLYTEAADSDVIIYNSTIRSDISTGEELLERSALLESFEAYKNDRVWCTNKSMFQKSTAVGDIVRELNSIILKAPENDEGFVYFHKVEI